MGDCQNTGAAHGDTAARRRGGAVAQDFVAACLQKDPALRPAASALLRHPFLSAVRQRRPRRARAVAATANPPRQAPGSAGERARRAAGALSGTALNRRARRRRALRGFTRKQQPRRVVLRHRRDRNPHTHT